MITSFYAAPSDSDAGLAATYTNAVVCEWTSLTLWNNGYGYINDIEVAAAINLTLSCTDPTYGTAIQSQPGPCGRMRVAAAVCMHDTAR